MIWKSSHKFVLDFSIVLVAIVICLCYNDCILSWKLQHERKERVNGRVRTEEKAYQQIVEEIIRGMSKGTLHQGDLIPPASVLAKELSLRKQDVKRAIRNLKTMGILETREKNRTYLVGNITDNLCESMHVMLMLKKISPYEICQMRCAMEITAFPLAFERKEKLDLEELKALLDQIHLGTVLESIRADEQSHMWLIKSSGNHLMECVMRSIWGYLLYADEPAAFRRHGRFAAETKKRT